MLSSVGCLSGWAGSRIHLDNPELKLEAEDCLRNIPRACIHGMHRIDVRSAALRDRAAPIDRSRIAKLRRVSALRCT